MNKLQPITVASCLLTLTMLSTSCADNKHQETTQTEDEYIIAESFYFAPHIKSAIISGVISTDSDDNKPEKVTHEVLTVIKENPGLETGEGFRAPLNLEQADCQLFGVNIKLSSQPDTKQWLVAPFPPCGKDKNAPLNLPFWLVEKRKKEDPRVLLAYQAHSLITWTEKHENYADVNITYQTIDGNEVSIKWYYRNNGYVYHSSLCTNFHAFDSTEPAYFTDCAPVKDWSNKNKQNE